MSEGASILSYNRKTGEFKTIYTAENAASFCTAVTFGDNVYFGTATADPATPQVILKLDKDGSFTGLLKIIGRYRYTTDKAFAKKKKQAGCKAGVAFYAAYANGTPVYELVKNGVYRYTTNKTEAKSLKSSGYTYKGIAWQAEKV